MFAKLIASLALLATLTLTSGSTHVTATAPDCCFPGSECCYPGSPCCPTDCCDAGAACCHPASACCAGTTTQVKTADCCDAGGDCCNPASGCCLADGQVQADK